MMKKLVMIRHGESEWNKQNLFTGWSDVDLSENGRKEAREAGQLLNKEGFDFDVCYTSFLKRSIHTAYLILEEMDREWIDVVHDWHLNERHYGALQGLDKAKTAAAYGEEQVRIWRRSYEVAPPALKEDDPRTPQHSVQYRNVAVSELPLAESLKDTVARVVPFYETFIRRDIEEGKRVLIVAHGNSLRALVKYLDEMDEASIVAYDIPTGVPLVYTLSDDLRRVESRRELGNAAAIAARKAAVRKQGSALR